MDNTIETIKNQLDNVDRLLDEYEKEIHLPILDTPGEENELQQYLSMNRNVLEKLNPIDCGQIAYRLSQFSFFLQRLYNREKARSIWASNYLNKIIAPQLGSYDKYMKYDAKVALIVEENSSANALQKVLIHCTQRMERLESLASELKHLSSIIKSIQWTKGTYNG